jgi:hypothetical protein
MARTAASEIEGRVGQLLADHEDSKLPPPEHRVELWNRGGLSHREGAALLGASPFAFHSWVVGSHEPRDRETRIALNELVAALERRCG